MAVCIRCGHHAEGEDERTLCSECISKTLAQLTIDDCIDIQKRLDKAIKAAELCEKMRQAKANGSD